MLTDPSNTAVRPASVTIPSFPDGSRIMLLLYLIMGFGVLVFVKSGAALNGFFLAWFGLLGLILLRSWWRVHSVVHPHERKLVRVRTFLGIPFKRTAVELGDYRWVERRLEWNTLSEDGHFDPTVWLTGPGQAPIRLQHFGAAATSDHPRSLESAGRIAHLTQLELKDIITPGKRA